MIGTFSALYKFLVNLLPICARWRRARHIRSLKSIPLGMESQGSSEESGLWFIAKRHQLSTFVVQPGDASAAPTSATTPHLSSLTLRSEEVAERRGFIHQPWHAALAGSVAGGVAVLLEKPSHRASVGQQLLVRYVKQDSVSKIT
jgi:hypothetical protein